MEQYSLNWQPARKTHSVSELNAKIREVLDGSFGDVWVAGEISGVRPAASGHIYFTLKDRLSQLRCACFRSTVRYLRFKPRDGLAVIARGRIDVYEARGEYQLLVDVLEPQGHGALQLAFEQLKQKLQSDGLFESNRKRALPRLPKRIGIVTSPSGAVIQDILNILERRFPGLEVRLFPALVQGEGSVEQVCRGLKYFSETAWADVVILARGGGSLEDLWTFNEEAVARNIAACSVPVISAVGHETDFTIADFVADLRAPTPSAAAEIVVCTREQLLEQLSANQRRLLQSMRYRLSLAGRRLHQQGIDRVVSILHRAIGRRLQRLDELEYSIRDQVRLGLKSRRENVGAVTERLRHLDLRVRFTETHRRLDGKDATILRLMEMTLRDARSRLEIADGRLAQLSPLRVLERGYALVQDGTGRVVRDADEVTIGESLNITVARGAFRVEVQSRSGRFPAGNALDENQ